jgi:non-ribosomal peptide synthetase component E (peptide arylation enzyme)
MPYFGGGPCVFLDKWDASAAIEIIQRHQVAFMLCATPFMQELLNLCEARDITLPSMRLFPCGGAAIPPELIYRVRQSLTHCTAFRLYGSSEAPLITMGYFLPGQEKLAAETDGASYDYEVKVVDGEGRRVEAGKEGEICARGPSVFLGYANEDDNREAFDDEGFFHSGDIGILNANGSLIFTGRIKDLINRGGEKISAKEVEDLLHEHPQIQEASVVAMPHERLGETVCAYIIVKNAQELPTSDILAFLENGKVAKQKLPEKFIFVNEFPKTPSGKVKKDLLRLDVVQRLQRH